MTSGQSQEPLSDQPLLPEDEVLRLNEWAEPAAWAFAFIAACAGGLLAFTDPSPHSELVGPGRLVLAAIWFAFALLFASSARAGLIIRDGKLEVRWRIRTRAVPWHEVTEFEYQRAAFRPALRMRLRSGEDLRILGFEARSSGDSERAEQMVAELNRRAAQAASRK